jgi:hypothetical protein
MKMKIEMKVPFTPGGQRVTQEDWEVLRQLISRRGVSPGYFFFIGRLIVNIPRGEERDYQVMRQLTPRCTATITPWPARETS